MGQLDQAQLGSSAQRGDADPPSARPYDLRHSFASLLLHEGRSVVSVARQLGHGAGLTLSTYGHVSDELEDAPRSVPRQQSKPHASALLPISCP